MTKRIYTILISLLLITMFSCKRYGDDPLTMRTPLNRITGTWEMTKYEIDGVDSLGLVNLPYTKMIFTPKRSKKYHLLYAFGYSDELAWKLDNQKQKLEISFSLFPFYNNDSLVNLNSPWNSLKAKYYYKQWTINKLTNRDMVLSTDTELPGSVSRSFVIHMNKVTNKTENDL